MWFMSCRWDFGDGSSKVIHTQFAPCKTMEGLMERGEKQVYVQDSVNYTYSIPGKHTQIHTHTHKQTTKATLINIFLFRKDKITILIRQRLFV